mgnify:CR=1 FL=1
MNELDEKIAEHFWNCEKTSDLIIKDEKLNEFTTDTIDNKGNEVVICSKCGNIIWLID